MTAAPAHQKLQAPGTIPKDRAPTARRLRLAYLTNQYPAVSHTFIRREILELERRGHTILRLSIRPGSDGFVDPADQAEHAKTLYCLRQSKPRLAAAALATIVNNPLRAARALAATFAMARRSGKGFIRHLAYFVEAAFLARTLRRERIEHLHVHFGTNPAAVARLIRMLGGPPFSLTIHGPLEWDNPRGLSLVEAMCEAAFTAAISDFCASQARRWLPPEHWDRVRTVRCTVGHEYFRATAPIDPSSRTILCIGRMAPEKGHLVLLEAFSRAVENGADARLVLAGDGELRPLLERRIRELALADRVEITGWINEAEVRLRLRDCRALALTSFAEGLPVVIMEALALARPVLSTYIAGIPELVRPGENGWLVPAGNAEAAAVAIAQIASLPASRLDAMGRAGQALVRERHSTETEVDRLEYLLLGGA